MVDPQQTKAVTVKPSSKSYGRVVLTLNNCLLPASAFVQTPSMADGLEPDTETDLRILGCELIQTAGILLQLPQTAMATGQVYLQRFYYSKSFVRFPMEMIAMACIYLASKVEEKPCRIRDVINVFHHIKQVRAQKTIAPLLIDQNYIDLKNQIIKAERRILKELGFCVHVRHPHKLIVVYMQVLMYEKHNQLVQMSWNYMNDALRTNVFMRYHPETIACACIYLSARKIGLPLPNKPHWFSIFDVKEEDIRDVCFCILRLYKRPKVNAEELEKKVDTLRHIYQANKLLNSQNNVVGLGKVDSKSKYENSPHSRDEKRDKGSIKSTTPPLKHHSRKSKHDRRSRSPYDRKDKYKRYRSRSNSLRRDRDRSRERRDDKRSRGYISSSSGTSRKYDDYERKRDSRDDRRKH